MAPAARMAMTRRIHPLVSLNPYQGNWTIKVGVTGKGNMRTYKNARGEGCVFNVELTDEDVSEMLDFYSAKLNHISTNSMSTSFRVHKFKQHCLMRLHESSLISSRWGRSITYRREPLKLQTSNSKQYKMIMR